MIILNYKMKKPKPDYTHVELLIRRLEDCRIEEAKMKKDIKILKDCATAFSFILPEPHNDILDSITHTELYRMQYKMAKAQWINWFNKNQ